MLLLDLLDKVRFVYKTPPFLFIKIVFIYIWLKENKKALPRQGCWDLVCFSIENTILTKDFAYIGGLTIIETQKIILLVTSPVNVGHINRMT